MITTHTIAEHANSLAAYLPGGRLFESAYIDGSKFRQFLVGLSSELANAEALTKEYQDQYSPETTTDFIEEWESALGIPDSCFSGSGTITERRRDVMVKLAALGVQTELDFLALALKFGVTVDIIAGSEVGTFPYTFPMTFFSSERHARFTLVVDFTVTAASRFPLTFPFVFGSEKNLNARMLI